MISKRTDEFERFVSLYEHEITSRVKRALISKGVYNGTNAGRFVDHCTSRANQKIYPEARSLCEQMTAEEAWIFPIYVKKKLPSFEKRIYFWTIQAVKEVQGIEFERFVSLYEEEVRRRVKRGLISKGVYNGTNAGRFEDDCASRANQKIYAVARSLCGQMTAEEAWIFPIHVKTMLPFERRVFYWTIQMVKAVLRKSEMATLLDNFEKAPSQAAVFALASSPMTPEATLELEATLDAQVMLIGELPLRTREDTVRVELARLYRDGEISKDELDRFKPLTGMNAQEMSDFKIGEKEKRNASRGKAILDDMWGRAQPHIPFVLTFGAAVLWAAFAVAGHMN
jgi:hypothetical protein